MGWGLSPSEFWSLSPQEFWTIGEARRPQRYVGNMPEDTFNELVEELHKSDA